MVRGTLPPRALHLAPSVISFRPCFADKETETQKGGGTAEKLVSGRDSIPDTPWDTNLAIPETSLPALATSLVVPASQPR